MKALYSAIICLAIVGCQKSEHAHHDEGNATESDSTNTILYNQVMDIHDAAMEKVEPLYNLKKDLQAKAETASVAEKLNLERKIAEIDSASVMMEDWMHEFNPPADTTEKEQIRAYLEAELVRVKQVDDAMANALKLQEN